MTGYMKSDWELFKININKVKRMANIAGVTSVSITGKGEPTLNLEAVLFVCNELKDYPIEIQTNGLKLLESPILIDKLCNMGVDIFAISMDQIIDFEKLKPVIERIKKLNRTVRVTLNITDNLPNPDSVGFRDYINYCKKYGIDQFSLRQITVANYTEPSSTHKWIEDHASNGYYDKLIEQFEKIQHDSYKYQFLGKLSYGAKLFDVDGISFTYFDYCIQDSNNGEDIRSLIYMEDGHVYTNWSSLASRIF